MIYLLRRVPYAVCRVPCGDVAKYFIAVIIDFAGLLAASTLSNANMKTNVAR